MSYENHTTIDQKKAVGLDFAFLAGLSVGVDVDRLFTGSDNNRYVDFEVRLTSDYLRRGERDDFYGGLEIIFWPFN